MNKNTVTYPPLHVHSLNAIAKLKNDGWQGPDVSLQISLMEYSIAWKDNGDEVFFIYKINERNGSHFFDRCSFKAELDVENESDWINWTQFASAMGIENFKNWLKLPLANKINDLVNIYGYENIFGTSYWNGFEIDGIVETFDNHSLQD